MVDGRDIHVKAIGSGIVGILLKFEDIKNLSQSLHSSKIHLNENRSSRLPGEILISSD